MKSRDIAIVGILLAVGAILRYFLAMLHTPMTPNMVIAFYCLAIILVRPKVYEALGIGIVAGILSMLITRLHLPAGQPGQRAHRGSGMLWRLCTAPGETAGGGGSHHVHRHPGERPDLRIHRHLHRITAAADEIPDHGGSGEYLRPGFRAHRGDHRSLQRNNRTDPLLPCKPGSGTRA